MSDSRSVVISGTGLYTPPQAISNEDLVDSFNRFVQAHNLDQGGGGTAPAELLEPSSVEFIAKASGIRQRYVVDREGILDPNRLCPKIPERPNEQLSVQAEIAVQAATGALEQAGLCASQIDAVIVACSNLQRAYPAVAIEVQAALGSGGFAYDMNVACSSATFGVQAARDAVRSGTAQRVLVISPEITSGHLNFRDRDSHFIFGDAATAVVVESAGTCTAEAPFEVLDGRLFTEFSNNIRNNFGFLNRADESGIGAADKLFVQNGRKVFKEVVPAVAALIQAQLDDLQVPVTAIKRMWLHQANLNMNQLIARKLLGREASAEEAPVILDEFANTSSAGSIIAFHRHRADFASGDLGIICSFGAGYSIGSLLVRRQ